MRTLAFPLIALLSIVDLAKAHAAEPRFRPALIGNGPRALINMIDTKKLMEKGQRDALLMFHCSVHSRGDVGWFQVWRDTPESKFFKKELELALLRSRFIPAIYNGERVDVLVAGTVAFFLTDGKPHLRMYANQNEDDIAKGNDFIAPQLLANSPDWVGSRFDLATQKARVNLKNGITQLSVAIDANGNQKDLKVISEKPPGFGLAASARHTLAKAKWIPGFRNGHPVDCTFEFPIFFVPWEGRW